MAQKPVTGQDRDLLERTRLLEEVGGTGYHGDLTFGGDRFSSTLIQVEDQFVTSADDQQGGAVVRASASPARSGRPPRDTIAWTSTPGSVAARNAAPAPVLAPK